MICFLCEETENDYTRCIKCEKVFCKTCLDVEKQLKSPLLSKNDICIFCRIKTNHSKIEVSYLQI